MPRPTVMQTSESGLPIKNARFEEAVKAKWYRVVMHEKLKPLQLEGNLSRPSGLQTLLLG